MLFSAPFGMVTCKLKKCADRDLAWAIATTQAEELAFTYITDPREWLLSELQAEASGDGIILIAKTKPHTLLQAALLQRREFSMWELRKALGQLEQPPLEPGQLAATPKRALLGRLAALAFPGDQESSYNVLELDELPPLEQAVPEEDPEMDELLQEMAVNDQAHAADMRAYAG